ncbi:hypothetical protein ACFX4N_24220 [Priestia sp. YIM B13551]|uniref:hypothetical protein n=1 Tax=Priestia sp. YIM B13551 TaxID=3366306 RepID=UPI00366D2A98
MSDQRRMRAELKQGLHQFLMTLYKSYLQTLPHEVAVEQISSCLEEEYEYFSKQSIQKENPLDFTTHIQQIETLARKEKDSVKQHELYEELEALVNAQEILAKYNMTEVTT